MVLYKRGFTLVELIIVISIITLFLTIGGVSYGQVKEDARDAKRVSDIEQIGFAIRLYEQEYGLEPNCRGGTVLEVGRSSLFSGEGCVDEAELKNYLANYFGEIPTDPLGPGDDNYYYYYDSVHSCFLSGSPVAMVFATNLEGQASNVLDACEEKADTDGGYMSTPDLDPTEPYVYLINRR